jgi:lipoprotein Spr
MRFIFVIFVLVITVLSCSKPKTRNGDHSTSALPPLAPGTESRHVSITTGNVTPAELITFARSLKGVPYKYGSVNPEQGFDCSGFVTCVFNHFGIRVPRPSVDFTFVNQPVSIEKARPGDLILFTGSDSSTRVVGHIGIVVSNHGGDLKFIHATSRKNYGVMETALTHYYQIRYMKTIRVFKQNDK